MIKLSGKITARTNRGLFEIYGFIYGSSEDHTILINNVIKNFEDTDDCGSIVIIPNKSILKKELWNQNANNEKD